MAEEQREKDGGPFLVPAGIEMLFSGVGRSAMEFTDIATIPAYPQGEPIGFAAFEPVEFKPSARTIAVLEARETALGEHRAVVYARRLNRTNE